MFGLLYAAILSTSSAELKCKDGTYPSIFIDGCLACPTDLKDCDGQPPYEKRTCKVRCRLNEEKPKTNATTTLPTEQQANDSKRFHSEEQDKPLLTTKASSPSQQQPSQDDTTARSRDGTPRQSKDKLLVLIVVPILVVIIFGYLLFDRICRRGTLRKPLCAGYILDISQPVQPVQERNTQPE